MSRVETLILRLLDSIVIPVWSFGRDRVMSAVERRNGIYTAEVASPDELGITHPESIGHQPTPWSVLRRAVPPEWIRPDDVFLDFGSGMGRVVYQAAVGYPFRRVIGVEFSAALHAAAQANIGLNRDRLRCTDVQLFHADVRDYEIPDDVTVAFFFNPFTGQTFQTVIDRLLASVDAHPRWLRIIYLCPTEHDRLMATGRVRLVKQLRRPLPSREWSSRTAIHLYDVLPNSHRTPTTMSGSNGVHREEPDCCGRVEAAPSDT